jgi:hypothetical protein
MYLSVLAEWAFDVFLNKLSAGQRVTRLSDA